jgi:cytochrome b561
MALGVERDMKQVLRYHPLLVTLHWLLAAALIALLATAFFILGTTSNADPHKIAVLRIHMIAGVVILNLMILRLVVRVWTAKPVKGATGAPLLERIAPIAHYGFYVLVVLMVMTGFATTLTAGLIRIMFQGSGDPLPPSFAVFPSFVAHVYLADALVGLIAVHVLAALYHQLVRRDGLLRRMTFGRSTAETPAE